MHPTDKLARGAGAIYLALALTAPFSQMYVPGKLIVRGDATATGHNILTHETLFRLGIVADLFTAVIFIVLVVFLYRLLRGVNKTWAILMVAFVLVSAAVGFLNTLNNLAALFLFRGNDFLVVIDKPLRDALAMLFLRLHSHGQFINEIFWGLWLLPLGLLIHRSRFLPRFLGLWLLLNCFAYVALALIAIFFLPYYGRALQMAMPLLLAELALVLWLLIKGAKAPPLRSAGLTT